MQISLSQIGKRLRRARHDNGLTLARACAITGYSESTLRRYETAGCRDVLILADLARAYGRNVQDIIFGPAPELFVYTIPPECRKFIVELATHIKRRG